MAATMTPEKAIEFVKGLSAEVKGEILTSLLNELVKPDRTAPVLVTSSSGRSFTVEVEEDEEYRKFIESIPPGIREKMLAPLPPDFDPDDCLTDEEVEAIMSGRQIELPSR